MARHIIFYAPLGRNLPPARIGGAEMGCRRTLSIYRQAGFDVTCIDKPARTGSSAAYAAELARTYATYVSRLLAHPGAIVHLAGFYDKIIDIERVILCTARALGHKTIYEIRNGGMIRIYNERNALYRRKQLSLLANASGILCQGECYVDFIRRYLSRESLYYPNYICDTYVRPWHAHDFTDGINLIYFGRIVPSKNVDCVIRCAAMVHSRTKNVRLHIVGAIEDDYLRHLQSVIDSSGMPPQRIIMHGHMEFDSIAQLLDKAHFFVFPSSEPNEGHSNSLTEAMGCGVVPVASTAGFNASICGEQALVINSVDARAYADTIIRILEEGKWEEYSRRAHRRVCCRFTQSAVGSALVQYVDSL